MQLDKTSSESTRKRVRTRVEGIVQGVGFRPYVHLLATRLGLSGFVANDPHGVTIETEGAGDRIDEFVERLRTGGPPLAVIERVTCETITRQGDSGFQIADSVRVGEQRALTSPDIATCADCLREMFDPGDRRYRYPFINCTNCGPRFTIIQGVPYDRPLTTMVRFAMCAVCAHEYHHPSNRRFHAQPNSCPACGPRLRLIDREGRDPGGDPILTAASMLSGGRIVAVKGIGGFHLAAAADNEEAVAALRSRKHREDKPFAVMVPDLAAAKRFAFVDDVEEQALIGLQRPIVLLQRRAGASVAKSVAGENRRLGLMLPYAPIHHLLCESARVPLVMTSGNKSDEPIAYKDEDAVERLGNIADLFLLHDRPIHIQTDDSVVRVMRGRPCAIRRSRGYAPQPLRLSWATAPILGCGAELKNTFCLARGAHAFPSHHVGDLENYETLRSFEDGIEHFKRLFDIEPKLVVCDLHPEYLSTKYARALRDVEVVAAQHHHAHIASCLADNDRRGPVIGIAFDGLGYGTDGTFWGGEFLVADFASFERVGTFSAVPMPGGAAAIREPWRMAAAHLDSIYGAAMPALGVLERNRERWPTIVRMSRLGVNAPPTSSVGRLFDAVAAMVGVRDTVNYEGQAAIELEQRAILSERGVYPFSIEDKLPLTVQSAGTIEAITEDLRAARDVGIIAARFHNTIARVIGEMAARIRATSGISTTALSGGVFQNELLLDRSIEELHARGFEVLTHHRVPTNDAGISLGQVAIGSVRAAAMT